MLVSVPDSSRTAEESGTETNWMWPKAVICVHIWFIKYTAFHCGITAEKGTSEVFVSLQPRAPGGLHVLSCYSSHQWGKTVKFIYLIKGPGVYELPNSANFLTIHWVMHGDVSRWKLSIAWCQGMFLKWLTLCSMELSWMLPCHLM